MESSGPERSVKGVSTKSPSPSKTRARFPVFLEPTVTWTRPLPPTPVASTIFASPFNVPSKPLSVPSEAVPSSKFQKPISPLSWPEYEFLKLFLTSSELSALFQIAISSNWPFENSPTPLKAPKKTLLS